MKRKTLILMISVSLILTIFCGCDEESVSKEIPDSTEQSMQRPRITVAEEEPQVETITITESQEQNTPESGDNPTKPEPNIEGPRIKFETTTIDFGAISTNSSQPSEFKFQNIGSETLKITNLRSTCGCTIAELKKRDYAPGEEGSITVTYSSSAVPGKVNKSVYVTTNDPINKTIQLTITGSVVKKVDAQPQKITLSLKEENGGCPDIVVKSLDEQSFAITEVKSTADCVAVDFDPSKKATSFTLKPQVDMEKLKKVLSGDIAFILTHPNCQNVTVQFEALPEFRTTSPTILILNAEAGVKVIRQPVWIINSYGEEFEIESVTSEKGTVKNLSVNSEQIGRKGLELEITPPEKPESNVFIDNVTVKTSSGDEVKIICRLYYKRT